MVDKRLHLKAYQPMRQTSIHFPQELYEWLRQEASLRHVTLSKVVNDAVTAQRTLRRQLASSLEVTPNADDGAPQVIHVLLERVKEELARTIDAQTAEIAALRDMIHVVQAMLDRSYFGYLLHTPPVHEAGQSQARTEAVRRYEKWIAEVRTLMPAPRRESKHGKPLTTPAATGASDRKAEA
jgi:hypothetical protein